MKTTGRFIVLLSILLPVVSVAAKKGTEARRAPTPAACPDLSLAELVHGVPKQQVLERFAACDLMREESATLLNSFYQYPVIRGRYVSGLYTKFGFEFMNLSEVKVKCSCWDTTGELAIAFMPDEQQVLAVAKRIDASKLHGGLGGAFSSLANSITKKLGRRPGTQTVTKSMYLSEMRDGYLARWSTKRWDVLLGMGPGALVPIYDARVLFVDRRQWQVYTAQIEQDRKKKAARDAEVGDKL